MIPRLPARLVRILTATYFGWTLDKWIGAAIFFGLIALYFVAGDGGGCFAGAEGRDCPYEP